MIKNFEKIENVFAVFFGLVIFFLIILANTLKVSSEDIVKNSSEEENNSFVSKTETVPSCNPSFLCSESYDNLDNSINESELKEVAITCYEDDDERILYQASEEEIILLAKLINRESCYEPYDGHVAVAATVLNRLKFAKELGYNWNNITDVIKEPGQYDNGIPVESYGYNNENYQAALDALAGVDPTNGAIYYYNPNYSDDTFIPSHIWSATIGNHEFYFKWEK